MEKRIIIGADGSGFELKEIIKKHLKSKGYEIKDVGTLDPENPSHYYEVGFRVGKEISEGNFKRGIVLCGSGMGVGISANKYPGVYAAISDSIKEARDSRIINNSNVLALGGNFVTPEVGVSMVDVFLETEFAEDLPTHSRDYLRNCLDQIRKKEEKLYK